MKKFHTSPRSSAKPSAHKPRRAGSNWSPLARDEDGSSANKQSKNKGNKPFFGDKKDNKHRIHVSKKSAPLAPARAVSEKVKKNKMPTGRRQQSSFSQAGGTVLLWGLHAAAAAWLNPARVCVQLFVTEAGEKTFAKTIADAEQRGLARPSMQRVERFDLDKMTPPGSVHQGIVCSVNPLPELDLHDVIGAEQPPASVVVLDQVTDPHNVGAILRSAAAFGAGAVIMTERNAPSATGVLAKSASGALEVVPMVHVVNLARALDDLREAGYWCVGLAEEGERSLAQLDLTGRTAIVLGAEGEGMRHLTRQKCDEMAHLPTSSALGSLNVSNAAAVALYEIKRQKPV